jgi:cystathionine beta-lyase/cystathionine gamma-synthase
MRPENRQESPKQETVSRAFQTVDESLGALSDFFSGKPTNFYDRYDNKELVTAEQEMAQRLGTDKVLLYNSGMSAITSALENLNLVAGDVLLYSPYVYGQTRTYIENLRNLGIRCIEIDPGKTEELQELIKEHHPRAVFSETMANDPKMQALDTQALFKTAEDMNAKFKPKTMDEALEERLMRTSWISDWVKDQAMVPITPEYEHKVLGHLIPLFKKAQERIAKDQAIAGIKGLVDDLKKKQLDITSSNLSELVQIIQRSWDASRQKPLTLILDNTIPTESIKDMGAEIKTTKAPVIIVDSGTKFMAKDMVTVGIVYTNDKDTMTGLYNWRAVDGGYLPRPSVEKIPNVSKEEFDARNRNIIANSKRLAKAFASVVGHGDIVSVSHPNLPGHPNYDYVNKNMPNGSVAVFYIECAKPAAEICRKLETMGITGKIEYGGSFAFEKTRFGVFEAEGKTLRVAAGNESPKQLEEICKIIESL